MKKNIISFKLLRIDKTGYHPICTLVINGKKGRFVIDTGASKTVMDTNRILLFADKKGIKKHHELSTGLGTSSMPSSLIFIPSLKIGTLELKNVEMVLLDLSHVNATYELLNHKAIDGVLGNDILKNLGAIISFPAKTITINPQKHHTNKTLQL